ncbi:MAG: ROK family protein [Planctomycetaceae bacterium]
MSGTSSASDRCWVGFDLGGTKMLCLVTDDKFHPIGKKRRKTHSEEDNSTGMDRVISTIEKALEDGGIDKKRLSGIGIGCPGMLDLDHGIVVEAANLGWQNEPVKEKLEKAFGCPAVILNDVDAGVYGEYRLGAAKGARTALGVFPGTGVGGGMVYEGEIFRGKNFSCLEVGHMQAIPDGPRCACGRLGCLEAVSSRLAIAAASAQAVFRGHAPHLAKMAGSDLANIRSGVLAEAIKQGDKAIEQIVRDAASHIGTAIGGLVHLLAPDVVVLGGGLVEAMPELYVEQVSLVAKKWVRPTYAKTYDVVATKLGDDASALGAAAWAEKNFGK